MASPTPDIPIKLKEMLVCQFREKAYYHDDPEGNPDAKIWIVDSEAHKTTQRKWGVWIDPALYKAEKKAKSDLVEWIDKFDHNESQAGFCKGRPLIHQRVQLPLCSGADMPRILYRVVHDKHPFGGTRARGYGEVEINSLTFQTHFQKHLKWACREKSPFLSTTNCQDKLIRLCAKYQQWGFTGIEVLVIDTTSDAKKWDNTRVYDVQRLLAALQLKVLQKNSYLENEYLIEHEIPPSCVTRLTLDAFCAQLPEDTWDEAVEKAQNSISKKRSAEKNPESLEERIKRRQNRTLKFQKVEH